MASDGQVYHLAFLAPDTHLSAITTSREVAPIGADCHRKDSVEGFGEDYFMQHCTGKGRILHLHALQVGSANGEPREIQVAQVAAQVFEQADDVGRTIALSDR